MRLPAAVQSLKMRRANTWFSWQSFTVTYVQDDCLTSMWWLIPIIVPIGVIWKYKQHISRSLRLPTAMWSLKIHRANTCFAWQSFTVTYVQDYCLTSMWWLIPIIVPIEVNWTNKQQICRPMRLPAAVRSLKMRRANTCLAKFYCNYIQDYCLTSMWWLTPIIVPIWVNWTDKQQIFRDMRLLAALWSLKMRRANTCFAWQSFTVTFKYT